MPRYNRIRIVLAEKNKSGLVNFYQRTGKFTCLNNWGAPHNILGKTGVCCWFFLPFVAKIVAHACKTRDIQF
jgi:hypothetical protein